MKNDMIIAYAAQVCIAMIRKRELDETSRNQMKLLEDLLNKSAGSHHRLCPRQVLGVRMGLYAGRTLDLQVPRQDKRLHAFMEIDGCAVDGVTVATGCSVGRRTMHILDFGKVAATFVDKDTLKAIRIRPTQTHAAWPGYTRPMPLTIGRLTCLAIN